MVKIKIVLFLLILSTAFAKAQVREISMNVGDSLTLGPCLDSNQFAYIDLMVKTRWPNPEATYDTLSGVGFYQWYFDGDIDSGRLPCAYSNFKFRIATVYTYKKEDGSEHTVIFGQFIDQHTVLWIEIEKAIESGEVIP